MFLINGKPTYAGRTWRGHRIEGLLLNSRMVQGTFDDLNPATRTRWAYPDTGSYDADRNTREFIAAMPEWRRHGLLAITLNLQGGSPEGYSKDQPWINSAILPDGSLRPEAMARLERILDRADQLEMVVILGLFYFGQDQVLRDEAAVITAVDAAVDWLFERDYRNVLIEVDNECDVNRYDHDILKPARVHELIERVKARTRGDRRLLVSTSYGGGAVPRENVVRSADFLLMHGNGVKDPDRIAAMVRKARQVPGYRPMPILFNEDDHFDFEQPRNNFIAALTEYSSWGFFDPGKNDYQDGYQSPPVRWNINTGRKRQFFERVREIAGTSLNSQPTIALPPELARVLADYEKAWTARDARALANLFAEDGFVLSPGQDMVRGRAQIEQHYSGSGGPLFLRAVAWQVSGNTGYILGGFTDKSDTSDIGKFTLTLRRHPSGRWLIMSDMDNGNTRR